MKKQSKTISIGTINLKPNPSFKYISKQKNSSSLRLHTRMPRLDATCFTSHLGHYVVVDEELFLDLDLGDDWRESLREISSFGALKSEDLPCIRKDDPVMVKNCENDDWKFSHFSHWKKRDDGCIFMACFEDGQTSWSSGDRIFATQFEYYNRWKLLGTYEQARRVQELSRALRDIEWEILVSSERESQDPAPCPVSPDK